MVARTGWGAEISSKTAMAEMKINVYNFANHQHLDAGSFQVYYKGPLTVNSGVYQGTTGGYGSDHLKRDQIRDHGNRYQLSGNKRTSEF